jgi:hypothetical protein
MRLWTSLTMAWQLIVVACGSNSNSGNPNGMDAGLTEQTDGSLASDTSLLDAPMVDSPTGESATDDVALSDAALCALSPCGGDVVGTWAISGGCVVSTAQISSCPTATVSMTIHPSGTVTFSADGTVSVNTMLGVEELITVPPTCLGGADCASMQASLLGQPGVTSASCTGSAGTACVCHEVFAPGANTKSDTYALSGTSITSPSGSPEPYCVQGNTLRWQDKNAFGTTFVITAAR